MENRAIRRKPRANQLRLWFAAMAYVMLCEMAGLVLGARQRGDDKARVGPAAGPFGLRDNPPLAAPAIQGRPREVLEAARWPAGPVAVAARRFQLGGDRGGEAHIAGQAEQVIDPIELAPAHQPLAGKAGIGTQQDPYPGPAGAEWRDDTRHFLHRAGAGIDIRPAQFGGQQMTATEDVERQIAVAVVIAMKKAPLLMPVQRVVGGVQIKDDLPRRTLVRLKKQIDK